MIIKESRVILPRLMVTGGSPMLSLSASKSAIFDTVPTTFCVTSCAAA